MQGFSKRAALAVLTALAAASGQTGSPERYRVGVTQSSKSYLDEQGQLVGLYIDVFREAARRAQLEYDFVWLGNNSLDDAFAADRIDLHVAVADTPARRRKPIFMAEPWWESPLVAVVPNESPYRRAEDLRGKRVAVTRGSDGYWDMVFPLAAPGAVRVDIRPPSTPIETLCAGGSDAALVVGPDAERVLAVHPPGCREAGFRFLRAGLARMKYSLGSQPRFRAVAEKLNSEIREMAAEGALAHLTAPWLGLNSAAAEDLGQAIRASRRLTNSLLATAATAIALVLGILIWHQRHELRHAQLLHDRLEELQRAEDRYRLLFQSPLAAVFTIALPGGEVVASNPAFRRLLGVGEAGPAAVNWFALTMDRPEAEREAVLAARSSPIRTELRRPDGSGSVPVLVVANALERAGGRSEVLAVALDTTPQRKVKELTAQLLAAEDSERRRLARELHDSTAQKLASLIIRLDLARGQELAEVRALAHEALDELRSVSYLLHPPLLDELGLRVALRTFLEGFETRSGLAVDLRLAEDLPNPDPDTSLAVFRILQESLANVQRHSQSKWVAVQLQSANGELRLTVRDGGPPLGGRGPAAEGVGISGMRERARLLGGHVDVRTSEAGTVVRAVLPLTAAAEQVEVTA